MTKKERATFIVTIITEWQMTPILAPTTTNKSDGIMVKLKTVALYSATIDLE